MLFLFFLIAGCALYGAIQQLQLSVAPAGRFTVVHLLLALLWLLLGALSLLHAGGAVEDPALTWPDPLTLLRLDNVVRFLMWICLIRLILAYTHAQETLIPLTLAGAWLVLIYLSLQSPLYGYYAHFGSLAPVSFGTPDKRGWFAIHLLMLANIGYALYLCRRYDRRGHHTTARILSASLIALLATVVYEMVIGLVAPPLPVIDLLGFLGFLLIVGFYLLPHAHRNPARVAPPEPLSAQRPEPRRVTTAASADALKAIGLYAEMGIRRLDRGAAGPDKLAALFRRIREEAAARLPPGSLDD